MKFSTSKKDNVDIETNYHKVTNKVDDSFIGVKIKNNKIDFYYPETYHYDDSSVENSRNDVLAILQTIAIAKTHSDSKIKVESSFSNNKAIPLLSYLWVVRDYLMNGFYVNREKVIKKNQRGKVDWKRTLSGQPIISNGNVVYSDLVVSVSNDLDNIIVEIHKYCVKKSIDILGWLFGIKSSSFIETKPFHNELKNVYIDTLKKELNQTFDDEKKERLKNMLSIIEGLSDDQNGNEIVYGVDSYAYIYERMINSIFGNRDATKFNPSANWYLKAQNYNPVESSDLRPDTILIKDNIAYVLDSKFYRFGYTADKRDLPETTSIQKQITYGDFIKNNKMGDAVEKIRNAFILPYNKYVNKLDLSGNLEYIGYSKTDYRKGMEDHEIIHAFLIDLKYVIETWNKRNHGEDVANLVKQIENIQCTKIKEERDFDFASKVIYIKDSQTFVGGILNSFYASINNTKLRQTLANKEILYVDGYFVINDAKYIEIEDGKKHLSEYAMAHRDECCLAFNSVEDEDIDLPYESCKTCENRKKANPKKIRTDDEHNQRIFLRAQDADVERVLEDNRDAIELRNSLSGSFGYNLNILMKDGGFSVNSLAKESKVDNKKISSLLDGSVMPTIIDCMRFCAALALHPIVARQLLSSGGIDIDAPNEKYQFYNFLINYCYGENLRSWQLKITETNHQEWQI